MWDRSWDFNNHPINRARDFEIFRKNHPRFDSTPTPMFACCLTRAIFWHGAHANENKYFPRVCRFYCLLDACLYKRNEWLLFDQLDLYVRMHTYLTYIYYRVAACRRPMRDNFIPARVELHNLFCWIIIGRSYINLFTKIRNVILLCNRLIV